MEKPLLKKLSRKLRRVKWLEDFLLKKNSAPASPFSNKSNIKCVVSVIYRRLWAKLTRIAVNSFAFITKNKNKTYNKKKHVVDNFYVKIPHDIHDMSSNIRNNFDDGRLFE